TPEMVEQEKQMEQEKAKRKEPEEKERQQKEKQKLNEEREKILAKNVKLYAELDAVETPGNYDIFTSEVEAIDARHGQIGRYFPEYAIGVSGDYFNLGFMKGVKYAKAEARKKAKKESR
ncbi:MAG: hypothetical protein IJY74_04660, partial [Oscillospiraceae bacterium]|nr:hypothetical protein [Oscillospiraceae bacterium]